VDIVGVQFGQLVVQIGGVFMGDPRREEVEVER
jgi:hypothetical protein